MPGYSGTLSRSLLALSVALLTVSPIYAPTWTVCSSGCDYTSIQDAVDDAEFGDTLQLSAETFVENVSIVEKDLQIVGAGPRNTVIDGGSAGPVFYLDLIGTRMGSCCGPRGCYPCPEPVLYAAALTGMTIRNGAGLFGGGVEQRSGQLVMDDCVVEGNVASSGGGISARGVEPRETPEVLNVENSIIRDNFADIGGGIAAQGMGTVVITTTTISANTGSPSAISSYSQYSSLIVNRSTISGNTGAVTIGGGALISTTTISGNQGIAIQAWGASIRNSTITGNTIGVNGAYRLTLERSILTGNTLAECVGVEYFYSDGHNLISDRCEYSDGAPDPTDIVNADPLLLPLADNGGPTSTRALAADSPAVDAGGIGCEPIDQRGSPRPQDGDGDGMALCDIGAFELIRPDPVDLLDELTEQVVSLEFPHGIANNLLAKLNAAALILGDLQPNNDHAAANILGAFIHHVQAQSGKKISASDADALIEAAEQIIELLNEESSISRPGLRPRTFPRGRRLGSSPQEPE